MANQKLSRADVLTGALVGDAASMGMHWLYDQEQIARIAASGDVLFRAPDANNYRDQKAFFAHGAKHIGDLSHYGEQVRVVAAVANSNSGYSTDAHRQLFLEAFGPCGSYVGYADRPTKALVAKMLTEGEGVSDPSGMDDDQLPALAVVPGLFASGASLSEATAAVSVISTNSVALNSVEVLFQCLSELIDGKNLKEALTISADVAEGDLKVKLHEALAWPQYEPLAVATHFGLPCHLPQGLPIVWHLLAHATGFEQCVRDNTLCGGDTCGRVIALGAIAGLVFGIPSEMRQRVNATSLNVN